MDYIVNAINSGITSPVYGTYPLYTAASRSASSTAASALRARGVDTYVPSLPSVPASNGDSGLVSYLFSDINVDFARVIGAYMDLMLFRTTSETFAAESTVDFLTYSSGLVSNNQAYSILTEARTMTSAIIDLYA